MPGFRFMSVLLLTLGRRAFGQACSVTTTSEVLGRTLAAQHVLMQASIEDDDTDVPASFKPVLHDFKQGLVTFIDLALRCGNPPPAAAQSGLAVLLHANAPTKSTSIQAAQAAAKDAAAKGKAHSTGIYGSDLQVHVTAAGDDRYAVDVRFGVECGDDAMLLLYRRDAGGWRRELAYYNADLNLVGDALGDFFLWSLVPGPNGQTLFAAAHGTPWCSSNDSMFRVDLLASAREGQAQRTLAHAEYPYRRDDKLPATMKLYADGFSLRAESESKDLNNLFIRPRVYRFQTTGATLERVQPVADNARDFVDVWMQEPWAEVAKWSAPGLQKAHDALQNDENFEMFQSFGPVLACAEKDHFQVELDMEADHATAQRQIETRAHQYAQVDVRGGMFFVAGVSEKADAGCKGPDLMKRR